MSNPDPHANEPKEIFQVGRCPYCGSEVEIDPTDMCCSEVHGDYVYEDEDGDEYSECEYREQQRAYDTQKII